MMRYAIKKLESGRTEEQTKYEMEFKCKRSFVLF